MEVRNSKAQRFYSLGLLEEAFQLSEKVGPVEAAKVSGVNRNSLMHYRLIRRREMGHKSKPRKAGKNAIDPVKKKKCFEMFQHLHRARFGAKRKCWIEAGERLGINGRSVEFQVVRGIWVP